MDSRKHLELIPSNNVLPSRVSCGGSPPDGVLERGPDPPWEPVPCPPNGCGGKALSCGGRRNTPP